MAKTKTKIVEEVRENHPRLTTACIGQEMAERQLVNAYNSGRMPHAWLFSGPKGVGKATLAYHFAKFLLAHEARLQGGSLKVDAQNPAVRRVTNESHADLMVVEAPDGETIPVDEVRALSGFLNHTPAEGDWRVVIIDAADAMNHHAANALLKMLEEPPERTVLILISHNPGTLIPTIRSRCRVLSLRPQSAETFKAIIQNQEHGHAGEELAYFQLSDGSAGVALFLMSHDALALYQAFIGLFAPPNQRPDWQRAYAIAGQLAAKQDAAYFQAFVHVMHYCFSQLVKMSELGATGLRPEMFPREHEILAHLAAFHSAKEWLDMWGDTSSLLLDVTRIHLDRRQVVLNMIAAMQAGGHPLRQAAN